MDQLAVHFQLDGNLIHKDSEEGKRQMTRDTAGKHEAVLVLKSGWRVFPLDHAGEAEVVTTSVSMAVVRLIWPGSTGMFLTVHIF